MPTARACVGTAVKMNMRARFAAAAVRRYSTTSETVATAKGQLRRNACSGDWVCIMSERASRPQQTMVLRADQKTTAGPSHDPDCPFCKGNEDQTSEPLLQIGTKKDWSLRIVKNKYPALTPPEGDMATSGSGMSGSCTMSICHGEVAHSAELV